MSHELPHPETSSEKACKQWATTAINQSTFCNEPKVVDIALQQDQDQDQVKALVFSRQLAASIQRALCLGRSFRKFESEAQVHRQRFETQVPDAAGIAESTDFRLQLKKKELEQAGTPSDRQAEELDDLWQQLMRSRNNQKIILDNKSMLEDELKEKRNAWRDAWLVVDRMLDPVLIESGFLKPYPEPRKGDAIITRATRRRHEDGRSQVNAAGVDRQSDTADRPQKRARVVADMSGKQQAAKIAELLYRKYRDNFDDELAKARSKSGDNAGPRGSASVAADDENEAKARDDFRQDIWITKAQELGRAWEQKRDDLKSAQLRAVELVPELESSLSIRSSYFNVTECGVWRSGESARLKLMEACQGWRQIAAVEGLGSDVGHSVTSPNNMRDSIYKYPVRPQDSGSREMDEYRAAPCTKRGQQSPRNSEEARQARLPVWRSELRPSEVGLSPLEGFRRAAMRQKSGTKGKAQSSLHLRREAPQTNVHDRDHHGYRQYSSSASEVDVIDQTSSHSHEHSEQSSHRNRAPRTVSYSRRAAEASRRHSRGRTEAVEMRSDHRSSDRGARLHKDRPDRDSIRGRSNTSHAKERQRDIRKHAAAAAKERLREGRPLGRERRTAMEILRKGSRRP